MRSALICDDEPIIRSVLKDKLEGLGFDHVMECTDCESAVTIALSERPDLILLDFSLPKKDGLSGARMIRKKLDTPILLLAENPDPPLVYRARKCLISAMLTKPVRDQDLWPAISMAFAHAERVKSIRKELHRLQEIAEKRKLIDEAKTVLMQSQNLGEAEAFRKMRRMSMDKQKPMVQIAEAILLTES